ncbi:efflux RND transporter periplasmic adaptor subunit [Pinisolibacter sp.]|uniref:efflux RND transporter periplasmic adaptor subunit n=1 Tax=Pinisolibacter sp. TaxID=2172024 RepID=UPI002FDE7C25
MRHLFLPAVFAVACLVAAQEAEAQGAPPAPPVTVAKPVIKDVQEHVAFTGRFDATQSVQVKSRVAGYLQKVAFTDGATVKKGDLLFAIDPRPYQASVDQAAAAVTVSETTLSFANGDLERATQLQKTGNITEQVFDQRRQAVIQATAKLAGDRAALAAAKLNLEFTQVKAPIDGRLSRTLVSEGTLVAANDTLLTTIVAADPIDFYFDVDETTFLAFERAAASGGPSASIVGLEGVVGTTDEPEPKRKARVDFFDNRVDQASGTMRVRAKVANDDLFLTPGLFGKIRVPLGGTKKGILLPDEAIASDQTRRIVHVVAADGSTTQKPVVPGPKIDGWRLIRSGLDGSETIAVNGIVRIRPGVKVTPQMVALPPVGPAIPAPPPPAAPAAQPPAK